MKRATSVLLAALSIVALGQAQPASRNTFNLGQETTIVTGPLFEDGTVNYIAAINELVGGNVKNPENAAIPLMALNSFPTANQEAILAALHAPPPPPDQEKLKTMGDFIAYPKGELSAEEMQKDFLFRRDLKTRPWKAADNKNADQWIQDNTNVLSAVAAACQRPKLFIPFVPAKNSPNVLDAMPVPFLSDYVDTLASRAMERAGSGDIAGAEADIRCIMQLARLDDQIPVWIEHALALGIQNAAMQAYAGLAASKRLNGDQLAKLRQDIEGFGPLTGGEKLRMRVNEMMALDCIMMCIRGDSEKLLRLMAWDFSQTKHVDLGDWPNADWDAAMKEVIRLNEVDDGPDKPYWEAITDLEKRVDKTKKEGTPPDVPFNDGKLLNGVPPVEAFLKMKPGETREAFSRRVAAWLAGDSPESRKRTMAVEARAEVYRDLAIVSIELAQFRLDHGTYPEKIDDLRKVALVDQFTGKPLLYSRLNDGYRLWSAGPNQKDDQGEDYFADDILVATEPSKAAQKAP